MKLLFILHDRPNYPGGPIVNYMRLMPMFVKSDHEVHMLVIYNQDYPNARELVRLGVKIYAKAYTFTEPLVKWILKKAEEIQPEVFIPDVSTQGCFAGKWLKESGIPVINTHRSPDSLNTGKAIYFSDTRYNHVLTGLVSVNRYLINKLNDTIGRSPVLSAVIPSGVPVPSFHANMQTDVLSVVYSGRLVEHAKRISLLINSFIQVCEINTNVRFTIIGDGPEKQKCINSINASPFASNFTLIGKLNGDEYKEELAKHQVIVLLSDFEGTPGSIMDGMSCGLIPVCLYYPGIEEIIEHEVNGLIVADRERSFQSAIEVLQKNKDLRERLSLNARQTIVNNFSIEIATAKWIKFFEECKNVSGTKRPFKAPAKLKLPAPDKLLLEDIRLPARPLSTRVKSLIPFYDRFKKFPKAKYDNFIRIPFNANNIDRYIIRTSILNAIKNNLPHFSGKLLDSGCGKMPYREFILSNSSVSEYIGLDIETALEYDAKVRPDFTWDGRTMPFDDGTFNCCMATEVLEHCPEPEVFLKEVFRVLKPGGIFFFTVPFLWNLHEVPHDEYRYTPFSLERHVRNSGFVQIEIKATGGWHASMAQMMGLWVRRAPLKKSYRTILSFIIKPLYRYLIRKDVIPIKFTEGTMITGLWGVAIKSRLHD